MLPIFPPPRLHNDAPTKYGTMQKPLLQIPITDSLSNGSHVKADRISHASSSPNSDGSFGSATGQISGAEGAEAGWGRERGRRLGEKGEGNTAPHDTRAIQWSYRSSKYDESESFFFVYPSRFIDCYHPVPCWNTRARRIAQLDINNLSTQYSQLQMSCSVLPLWTLNASSQSVDCGLDTAVLSWHLCLAPNHALLCLCNLLDVFVYKHLCTRQHLNGLMKPKRKDNEGISDRDRTE